MADIEKVMYDLMDIKERNKLSESEMQTIDDANELLKEQENTIDTLNTVILGYEIGANKHNDNILKEQEAVEPKPVDLYGNDEWWGLVCVCPNCKAEWMSDKADTHFCPKCGQAVKWE